MKIARLCYTIAALAFATLHIGGRLQAQEPRHKTPFDYQINIGGMTPAGKTASTGPYSPSFMIGGGVGLPLRRWVTLDVVSMDFGFGTTNQTQTIQVSDGTTRTTRNYQMLFSSGPRFNVPLGRRAALGLGGGYAGLFQNEYVPDTVTNNGVVTLVQSVNCTTCSRNAYQGPYMEARLFGRSDKFASVGMSAKYYIVKDTNHSAPSNLYPPQRWLSIGVTFTFGI